MVCGTAVIAYRLGQANPAGPVNTAPTCDAVGANGCVTVQRNAAPPVVVVTTSPAAPVTTGPPPPPPPPPVPTIQDGTWTVGQDFPPGTYRTEGTAGSTCYWAITKSGSNGSEIVDNHIGAGHLTVTLKVGQDFETERCGTWKKTG